MSVELISVLIAVLAVGATLGGLILTGNPGLVGMVVAPLLVTALSSYGRLSGFGGEAGRRSNVESIT